MKKKKNSGVLLFYILLIGIVIFAVAQLFSGGNKAEKLTYSDVKEYFKAGLVQSFEVDSDNTLYLSIRLKNADGTFQTDTAGKVKTEVKAYKLRDLSIFYDDIYKPYVDIEGSTVEVYDYAPPEEVSWFSYYLPWIIMLVILVLFTFFFMRSAGGGGKVASFGRSRARLASDPKQRVTFDDVAGADEEKEELVEVVEYLRSPDKYRQLGAKIPHGVLLVGPPGTGKTLLAKAVAGEAGVPFYSISGSDFVEMYVGVGASRVRDLFDNAKKSPASIVFIDEIDAVGRHRGAGLGGGHDEREQTLNQLLVEMDGFGSHDGVIVMAATNRPDILDPALLRPGRFDRQITVGYPDIKGREDILAVHAKNKPLADDVDFHRIAQVTVGFTGADLANLLNESALLAARKGKSVIDSDDVHDAYMKVILGPQKKTKVRSEHDNKLCAYHETGHAISAFYSPDANPVKHITIIPTARTGGVTLLPPAEDRTVETRNEMFADIVTSLGGRVAEMLVMEDISTGASNDIQQATARARAMVTRYGMSDKLGTVLYGSEHNADEVFLGRDFSEGRNYSEQTAAQIDEEIRSLIDRAYAKSTEILSAHMDQLHFVAGYLLAYESMDEDQFRFAMENPGASYEDIAEIAEEKRRKSAEQSKARAAKLEAERLEREREREEAEARFRS